MLSHFGTYHESVYSSIVSRINNLPQSKQKIINLIFEESGMKGKGCEEELITN